MLMNEQNKANTENKMAKNQHRISNEKYMDPEMFVSITF